MTMPSGQPPAGSIPRPTPLPRRTPYLCPSLRPCQPGNTDAVQHFPIPLHPLS